MSTKRSSVLAGAQTAMAKNRASTRHVIYKLSHACIFFTAIVSTAVAAADAAAAGDVPDCAAMYAKADRPLLFGGVHGACTGSNCQPRQDEWSDLCDPATQPPPFRGYAICTAQQTADMRKLFEKGSDAAAMAQFTPCMLYSYLKGRTLWVMGDSLMRNYYYALRCFMIDFWDHGKGECAPDPQTSVQRRIYMSADTNISSSMGSRAITDVPKCLYLLGGGRICWVQSVRGEEFAAQNEQNPGVLQVLQHTVANFNDIFFLNFGRWHYTNCYGLQDSPYRQSLNELGSLYQLTKAMFPNLIYKTISADHTACRPTAKLVQDQCLPSEQGSYPPMLGMQVVSMAEQILARYGVPILDTYNMTREMHLGHILLPQGGVQDCVHYCSPGVPEWEIWNMYKAFRRFGIAPLSSQAAVQGHPACIPVTDIRPPPGWSYYFDEVNANSSRKGDSKPQQQRQLANDDKQLAI